MRVQTYKGTYVDNVGVERSFEATKDTVPLTKPQLKLLNTNQEGLRKDALDFVYVAETIEPYWNFAGEYKRIDPLNKVPKYDQFRFKAFELLQRLRQDLRGDDLISVEELIEEHEEYLSFAEAHKKEFAERYPDWI